MKVEFTKKRTIVTVPAMCHRERDRQMHDRYTNLLIKMITISKEKKITVV